MGSTNSTIFPSSFPVDEDQVGLIESVDLESLIPPPWQFPLKIRLYDAVNYSLTDGLSMDWGFSYNGGLAENGGISTANTSRRFDESLFWEAGFYDHLPNTDPAFEITVSPAFVPPNGIDLKGSGYHVSRVEFELESFQLLPPLNGPPQPGDEPGPGYWPRSEFEALLRLYGEPGEFVFVPEPTSLMVLGWCSVLASTRRCCRSSSCRKTSPARRWSNFLHQ